MATIHSELTSAVRDAIKAEGKHPLILAAQAICFAVMLYAAALGWSVS